MVPSALAWGPPSNIRGLRNLNTHVPRCVTALSPRMQARCDDCIICMDLGLLVCVRRLRQNHSQHSILSPTESVPAHILASLMLSPFFLSVLSLSLISLCLLAHIYPWSSNAGEALKRLGETKAARVALSKYEQMTKRVRGRETERGREHDRM